jgi:hypothetical protein
MIDLQFSNAACSMDAVESSVIRHFHFERYDSRTKLIADTKTHNNYMNESIGGGTTITHTAEGMLKVGIPGVHKVLAERGKSLVAADKKKIFDHSIRTLEGSELLMSYDKDAGTKTAHSGKVEVSHNLAKFKAVFTMREVVLKPETCCHPISGSMSVEFSGSRSGSAVTTFTETCGVAKVVENSQPEREITLRSCE